MRDRLQWMDLLQWIGSNRRCKRRNRNKRSRTRYSCCKSLIPFYNLYVNLILQVFYKVFNFFSFLSPLSFEIQRHAYNNKSDIFTGCNLLEIAE